MGFIGGGNMARSLIGGLCQSGLPPSSLHVSEPDETRRQALHDDYGITVHGDNQAVVDACEVVVLAVKPQALKQVISELQPGTHDDKLYLTIAAGIRTDAIQQWLGGERAIVRAMPNTPALVQSGATGLFANAHVSDEQKGLAESIMRAVGLTVWIEEEAQMDAVTAVSGSGPAYFFLVMEAMEQAGVKLGLPEETARLLTLQTAFGAAKLALEIEEEPARLRRNVTSPGGTTEQAILALQDRQLEAIFEQALQAARDRARELADELGQ
ncbi:MAG: pyrroline-5-carboxylate reductase [Thiohalophilus sp.]|uniref:pyrroline-5-carboxylate reductase n=1 Tax=Thiohalophilus sp. TaxID=3028392 RepID=UPI00286FF102|nr:pyrroline-5-carboxylate reductase [Thiohalophilus sp.]MDR9436617.1 pyrroline-5-carboxylate reductase [Thiohalophilus sp.]